MTATVRLPLRPGQWQVVASSAIARFAVRNFGVKTVHGTVPIIEAWVHVDDAGHPGAVHELLDLAGIDTGNPRRDRDLRRPSLLDTEQFPTLRFDGGPAERSDGGTWVQLGRLHGRDAAAPVMLTIDPLATAESGAISVRASTEFDRRDLMIRAPRVLVGRRVAVTIEATFTAPE